MKKKILKVTLAVVIILASFLNSSKFLKVFSSDINLANLSSVAIASCESSEVIHTESERQYGLTNIDGVYIFENTDVNYQMGCISTFFGTTSKCDLAPIVVGCDITRWSVTITTPI